MQLYRPLLATTCLILPLLACSASSNDSGSVIDRGSSSNGAGGEINLDNSANATTAPSMGGTETLSLGGTSNGGNASGGACATATTDAELVKEPVDIIMVVDNSGSMDDELASVEANINDNFGNILLSSDIDYRLIAISRHRDDDNTSLCVSAPLSSNETCPAEEPGITERFKHYSTKVESDDSFDLILDTYEPPFGGDCLSTCDNGDTSEDDADDKYENDMGLGWSTWLRSGAKKVFLEITDANEDMPVSTFVSELTAMAPENFGTAEAPTFIFHAITGVAEKGTATDPYTPDEPIVSETCEDVTDAGETYQELAILTGGLRLPVCQYEAYDSIFQEIAQDVIIQSNIACDFAIPEAPAGQGEINLDNVAVNYTSAGGGDPVKFGQAKSEEQCEANAFYIEDQRIWLCPQACDTVRADPLSTVDVLFTCESQIIIK